MEETLSKPEVQVTFAGWQRDNDPLLLEQSNRRMAKYRSVQALRDAEDAASRDCAWKIIEERERQWNEKHGQKLPKGSLPRSK